MATALLLVVLLAAASLVAGFGPQRVRNLVIEPAPPTPTVPRPTPTTAAAALGEPPTRAAPQPAVVQRRLGGLLHAEALGRKFGAHVVDPETGKTLLSRRGSAAATPASTAKLATSVAALQSLGPDARLSTRVVRDKGAIVLVGGGDPTLLGPKRQPKQASYPGFARLAHLAADTARELRDAPGKVTVRIDDSLFSGPRTGPGWKPNYVPEGSVAPVSALAVDRGRKHPRKLAREADPAMSAGETFAALLTKRGVQVKGKVARVTAGDDATELAEARSPTIAELVEVTLGESDNDVAEALARQVALQEGKPASFAGASAAVRAVLRRLDVGDGITLRDGSGLSTENQVTPKGLTGVLRAVVSGDHPKLGAVLTGMPVGGFSGTLSDRFAATGTERGVGVVRAKTGSLSDVSSLAGYVQDDDGRVLVFAFVANGIPPQLLWHSQPALDRLAAALASCGCR